MRHGLIGKLTTFIFVLLLDGCFGKKTIKLGFIAGLAAEDVLLGEDSRNGAITDSFIQKVDYVFRLCISRLQHN